MADRMQPKWQMFGRSWEDFGAEGHIRAGTLVEVGEPVGKKHHDAAGHWVARVESGVRAIHLIGDINMAGGVCDDCAEVDADDIVHRYVEIISDEHIASLVEP